jgi:hypothetical protein
MHALHAPGDRAAHFGSQRAKGYAMGERSPGGFSNKTFRSGKVDSRSHGCLFHALGEALEQRWDVRKPFCLQTLEIVPRQREHDGASSKAVVAFGKKIENCCDSLSIGNDQVCTRARIRIQSCMHGAAWIHET